MAKLTWPRVVMNKELDRIIRKITNQMDRLSMLEISGSRWKVEGENTEYTQMNYPEHDLCNTVLDKQFNLIIAEMIFEHLPYPYRAGRNIYQMLEDKGYFVITVPFLYPIHRYPIDCCRWNKMGLKYFLVECGFDIDKIYTDSWGNKDCLMALCDAEEGESVNYNADIHNLENEPLLPISVWGVAQK